MRAMALHARTRPESIPAEMRDARGPKGSALWMAPEEGVLVRWVTVEVVAGSAEEGGDATP